MNRFWLQTTGVSNEMGNSKHRSYTTSPSSLLAAERVALEEDARLAYVAHARCAWAYVSASRRGNCARAV